MSLFYRYCFNESDCFKFIITRVPRKEMWRETVAGATIFGHAWWNWFWSRWKVLTNSTSGEKWLSNRSEIFSCRCKSGSKYAKKHLAFCTDTCGGLKKKKNKKATAHHMKKKAITPKKTSVQNSTPVSGSISETKKVSATEPLGPLGELFKSLVVANTWWSVS